MSQICIPIPSSSLIVSVPSSSVIGVGATPIQTPSVNILRVEPAITGLVGGGSSNLDGIVTATGKFAVGICIFLVINGVPAIYQLTNGNNAESLPLVVRPNDFDEMTNAKVWIQRM